MNKRNLWIMTPKRFQTIYIYIIYIYISDQPITDLPARTRPNSPCPHSSSVADAPQKIQSMRQVGFIYTSTGIRSIRKTPIERSCENGGTAPVELGRLSDDLQGFIYTSQVVGLGISEPINSIKSQLWVLSSTQSDHPELPRLASSIHIKLDGVEFVSWFWFLSPKKWDKVKKKTVMIFIIDSSIIIYLLGLFPQKYGGIMFFSKGSSTFHVFPFRTIAVTLSSQTRQHVCLQLWPGVFPRGRETGNGSSQ